jgi:hypothetical protein
MRRPDSSAFKALGRPHMKRGRAAPETPLTNDWESFDEQLTDCLCAPWLGLATADILARGQRAYQRTQSVLHDGTKLNR